MKQKVEREQITLLFLGHIGHIVDYLRLSKWKSRIFTIAGLETIRQLPSPDHITGYLDQAYLDDQLRSIAGPDREYLRIGIINCELENNFYVRRILPRTAVISTKVPMYILHENKITIENFIIKNIYEMITMYKETGDLSSQDVYTIPHRDTRRCLFDLNGDIGDIIYNTEEPTLCAECKTRLSSRALPANYIETLERELKRIRKNRLLRLEISIKKYPLTAILVSVLFGILLNVCSSLLVDSIKSLLGSTTSTANQQIENHE